jgi:hypothetical protein
MNKGRVGEDRGSKETDGCPLTGSSNSKDGSNDIDDDGGNGNNGGGGGNGGTAAMTTY